MISKILKKLGLERADVLPLLLYTGTIVTIILALLKLTGIIVLGWFEVCLPIGTSLSIVVILVLKELGFFRR